MRESGGRMAVRASRMWKSGVCSTYMLLLAIMFTGSYLILFSPALNSNREDAVSDDEYEQLLHDIDITKDRIFEVKYEPVFDKYYEKYYGQNASFGVKRTESQLFRFKRLIQKADNQLSNLNGNAGKLELANDMSWNQFWQKADSLITNEELFPETDVVHEVIDALATAKIVAVDVLDIGEYESGTSEKWTVMLQGGQKAVIKIMWEEKGKPKPGGLCNYGYEMPWAEIVGFHLHRVLGFRNTPYVAGRKVDIRKEILPVASPRVAKRIEVGVGKQICIVGQCHYCTRENRLCPKDGMIEVSIAYWIPRHLDLYTWWPNYMPWATPRMEEWKQIEFNNRSYCDKIRKEVEPYEVDQFYHDLFDFAILDTLMYHFDSKHYVVADDTSARGLTIRLDHGRAFCRHDIDEENIFMAPIFQCCTLRRSTYEKLKRFQRTELFSRQLKMYTSIDNLAPFLGVEWYTAFERRLKIIFKMIDKCATANGGLDNILV